MMNRLKWWIAKRIWNSWMYPYFMDLFGKDIVDDMKSDKIKPRDVALFDPPDDPDFVPPWEKPGPGIRIKKVS